MVSPSTVEPLRTVHGSELRAHEISTVHRLQARTVRINRGDIVKDRLVHAEILRQDILGRVRNPVIHHERRPRGVEVPVIKNKKVLVLIPQTLQGVGFALGEIPDVARLERFDLVLPVLVHGRQKKLTRIEIAPFGHPVPVQLAVRTLGQMLLGAGDVVGRWKVGDDLLAHPSAIE